MRYGFVGTGEITQALVTGLAGSDLPVREIVLSPRNAEIAAALAARFPIVRIGADNQAVVDGADVLFLAVRPQVAEGVVGALRFRPGQLVVSLIAATPLDRLSAWIDGEVELVQAIPLPFAAERRSVTAIHPPHARVAAIFSALGTAVECETKREYDLAGAASALMATYLGILERTTGWLEAQGMPTAKARAYLLPVFANLSQMALASGQTPFDELRRAFATRGGLNEQVFADFDGKGGSKALLDALDRVLARIEG